MTDMAMISGAVSSLKAAGDMAKALVGIRDAAILNEKIIELQRAILAAQTDALAAQSEQFSLLDSIRQFEARIASLEKWETDKQRYELTDFGGGTFAYLLKENMRNGEAIHRICANCYQQGNKSILHFKFKTNHGQDKYFCPACKTEFDFGMQTSLRTPQARAIRSDWMDR